MIQGGRRTLPVGPGACVFPRCARCRTRAAQDLRSQLNARVPVAFAQDAPAFARTGCSTASSFRCIRVNHVSCCKTRDCSGSLRIPTRTFPSTLLVESLSLFARFPPGPPLATVPRKLGNGLPDHSNSGPYLPHPMPTSQPNRPGTRSSKTTPDRSTRCRYGPAHPQLAPKPQLVQRCRAHLRIGVGGPYDFGYVLERTIRTPGTTTGPWQADPAQTFSQTV